jgi:hypothetical protein
LYHYTAGRKEVIWGTEQGSCGQLFLDGEAVQRGWVLDGKRGGGGGGGVSAGYAEADITGDGVNEVVIGRDNGSLEVYSLDKNGEPVRVYQRDLNEAVQSVKHGCVSGAEPELLVHTFSGKVLAFKPGADTQTIDGFALGVPQSQTQVGLALPFPNFPSFISRLLASFVISHRHTHFSRYFDVKTQSVDDGRYVPCNQSDTPRE